ncbi:15199_t:CDS:2 [Acaulospora colombiana]|uniref:15199_t:CDS:1 n=1 Tax=Acaulospora colombiana TaxID=27376 RepID=A0ACA9LIG7_9GLOM|nr:15199_t:CDS:2 [Acaulospora colombiana]
MPDKQYVFNVKTQDNYALFDEQSKKRQKRESKEKKHKSANDWVEPLINSINEDHPHEAQTIPFSSLSSNNTQSPLFQAPRQRNELWVDSINEDHSLAVQAELCQLRVNSAYEKYSYGVQAKSDTNDASQPRTNSINEDHSRAVQLWSDSISEDLSHELLKFHVNLVTTQVNLDIP